MIEIKNGLGCRIVGAQTSEFGHQFGGGQEYRGTVPEGARKAVHLLFRLSLRDPLMPLQLEGVDWLPVFYSFQYDGCGMG
jgi:hypothetical protein